MKYTTYTTVDFVMDENFQAWVLAPTRESEQFWQNWIGSYPEKKAMIEEAKMLIRVYGVEEKEISATSIERILSGVKQGIKKNQRPKYKATLTAPPSKLRHLVSNWYMTAAVFIGFIIMAGAVYWTFFHQQTSYVTTYGEVKEIILPDGSQITLNGNSRLYYTSHWEEAEAREVWLEGEAFFHVQDISQHVGLEDESVPEGYKFIVHTHDLNIIVLGTQFNVNSRSDQVKVVLNSGKVKIKVADDTLGNEIFMEPGEMVAYDVNRKTIGKQTVDPKNYSSWRDNYLVFDEVPLYEVAEILEDTYGVQITFEGKEVSRKIIRSTIPSDDIDILLKALPQSCEVKVNRQGNHVFISRK